jgi:glycosyltransferase involved in cell wall biosynthesis
MRELTSNHHTFSEPLDSDRRLLDPVAPRGRSEFRANRPRVSVVTPAYNEALIIQSHLALLCDYMRSLESQYDWEILVVNDGSRDESGQLAEQFAKVQPKVRVVHHRINQGLGQALRTAFDEARGDYIVVMDLDLSYSPDHIERLLDRIYTTGAGMVVASPYMPGGSIDNVPWFRKELSIWANRFLSFASKRSLATLTGMVRVYDAEFVRMLHLRSRGMDINPEIIHKSMLLLAQIEEIPGHLHWLNSPEQPMVLGKKPKKRGSSMKILRHTLDVLFSGFLFRPGFFFVLPAVVLFGISLYANMWFLIHCGTELPGAGGDPTVAVAHAFQRAPHTITIGGITLMLSIQLFSLGVLSSQSKSYFEELFSLGSATYRRAGDRRRSSR